MGYLNIQYAVLIGFALKFFILTLLVLPTNFYFIIIFENADKLAIVNVFSSVI